MSVFLSGIIGGGIGGTTAAYFLRQLFGDKLKVDILEADKIGGRLALINIGGQDYEAGGAIIHPKNRYMVNFTEQFGKAVLSVTCTVKFQVIALAISDSNCDCQ